MGARLVRRVILEWPDLPDRQWRVLIRMAFVAHDDHKEPTYWRGRDDLVAALGLPVGQENSYRMVRNAATQLVKAGAVKRGSGGKGQQRQRYILTLDRTPSERLKALEEVMRGAELEDSGVPQEAVDNSPEVPEKDRSEADKGDSGVPLMGDSERRVGGLRTSSRGTQESPGGLHEEERGTRGKEEQSSSPSTHQGEPRQNGQSDISILQAKRILRDKFDDGGRSLIERRPFGMNYEAGTIWAARTVLTQQEAAS